MKARLALAGAMILALGGQAAAQPPAPLKISMDYDGTLYAANLIPVKVLVIHADGDSKPGGFAADVSMKSYGILRALKRVDIDAESQGRADDDGQIYPGAFTYIHHDGKRVRHVHVNWTKTDVQVNSTPPYFDLGHPAATCASRSPPGRRRSAEGRTDSSTANSSTSSILAAPSRRPCPTRRGPWG
jgi:hypothetical protein